MVHTQHARAAPDDRYPVIMLTIVTLEVARHRRETGALPVLGHRQTNLLNQPFRHPRPE